MLADSLSNRWPDPIKGWLKASHVTVLSKIELFSLLICGGRQLVALIVSEFTTFQKLAVPLSISKTSNNPI